MCLLRYLQPHKSNGKYLTHKSLRDDQSYPDHRHGGGRDLRAILDIWCFVCRIEDSSVAGGEMAVGALLAKPESV